MIRQMYVADGTGSVSVDMTEDDVIEEVHLEVWASGSAGDTDYADAYLSFGSSSGTNVTNDFQSNIAIKRLGPVGLTTSGSIPLNSSVVVHPQVKAFAGERIYLHVINSGFTTAHARATIYTKASGAAPATRRR